MYVNTVNNFGNDKQKEEFLRPFTDGKNVASFSLSEPGIGEHLRIHARINSSRFHLRVKKRF